MVPCPSSSLSSSRSTTAAAATMSTKFVSSRKTATTALHLATDMMMTSEQTASDDDKKNNNDDVEKVGVVTKPFNRPPRVVLDDLPTVYVYDHCPFCVRVRLALGFKNVKHNLVFLANDDVATPTSLVGKKIAPIFVSSVVFLVGRRRRSISVSMTFCYVCHEIFNRDPSSVLSTWHDTTRVDHESLLPHFILVCASLFSAFSPTTEIPSRRQPGHG
jgi:hypothetical protein